MKFVHFLLDETGSMGGMKEEAIAGYNMFVDELEKQGTDVHLALTKFDTAGFREVHPFVPCDEAIRLNDENYRPGAGTNLFDAVVHIIRRTEEMIHEEEKSLASKPDVLIVVLTDGGENASQDNDKDKFNAEVKEHEDSWGWSFTYLGASPDAWSNQVAMAGTQMLSSTVQSSGKEGLRAAYQVTTEATKRWADAPQAAAYEVTDEEKQRVIDASDQTPE